LRYLHVKWIHDFPDDPIDLYIELDDGGWEVRKVELFPDGRMGYADASDSSLSTALGLKPVPDPEEIALDPQFRVEEITRQEFERLWDIARLVLRPE
jgi:hypothetical protein